MLAEIEEMEVELSEEFGKLAFTMTTTTVPFGITLDKDYREVTEAKVYNWLLEGHLVLPDGTKAYGTVMLPAEHTRQQERHAMTTITVAVLRRLARFYQKEKV